MKKHTSPLLYLLTLIFVSFLAQAKTELSPDDWTAQNQSLIKEWQNKIAEQRPESLCVAVDLDNTAWAGDVTEGILSYAEKKGLVKWKSEGGFVEPLQQFPLAKVAKELGKNRISISDYVDYVYEKNSTLGFPLYSQVFAGLTLAQISDLVAEIPAEDLPTPYPAMISLLNQLRKTGVAVAFVSASPTYLIMPMLERTGYAAPLAYIEGYDVQVSNPKKSNAEPILFSDLVQSRGIKTWKGVIAAIGNYRIEPVTNIVASAREGKAVGVTSVMNRHVSLWNQAHSHDLLSLSDMRLAAVFGDNYAPFSDLPGATAVQNGNDQGMIRAWAWMPDGIIVNIDRVEFKNEQYIPKQANIDNATRLFEQFNTISPGLHFIRQPALAKGSGHGRFFSGGFPH